MVISGLQSSADTCWKQYKGSIQFAQYKVTTKNTGTCNQNAEYKVSFHQLLQNPDCESTNFLCLMNWIVLYNVPLAHYGRWIDPDRGVERFHSPIMEGSGLRRTSARTTPWYWSGRQAHRTFLIMGNIKKWSFYVQKCQYLNFMTGYYLGGDVPWNNILNICIYNKESDRNTEPKTTIH